MRSHWANCQWSTVRQIRIASFSWTKNPWRTNNRAGPPFGGSPPAQAFGPARLVDIKRSLRPSRDAPSRCGIQMHDSYSVQLRWWLVCFPSCVIQSPCPTAAVRWVRGHGTFPRTSLWRYLHSRCPNRTSARRSCTSSLKRRILDWR